MTPESEMLSRRNNLPTVIALDVVGTIIEPAEPIAVTYARFAQQHGAAHDIDQIAARLGPAMHQIWNPMQPKTDEATERQRWQDYVRLVLPQAGHRIEAIFSSLWQHYASSVAWRWFPDAQRALERLTKSGTIWGLASNFDTRLHRWAAEQPELQSAAFILTSADLGCLKASPDFYVRLKQRVQQQTPATSVMPRWCMIGDQPANDIHPARHAGWETVWLRRPGTSLPITEDLERVPRVPDLESL